MRQIKFRLWDVEGKQMLRNHEINYDFLQAGDFKYFIPMQFIGLYDKNGKEIYEGDIVKYGNDMPIEVVFKQEGCFTFKQSELPLGRFQISKMEVVGNIHENPELIPKKEEGHE